MVVAFHAVCVRACVCVCVCENQNTFVQAVCLLCFAFAVLLSNSMSQAWYSSREVSDFNVPLTRASLCLSLLQTG